MGTLLTATVRDPQGNRVEQTTPLWSLHKAPSTIPSDGSRDVTTDLNGWLASLPRYTVAQLAKNGRYRVDGIFRPPKSYVTIEAEGATIDGTRAPAGQKHLVVELSDHLTFRELTVEGNHLAPGTWVSAYAWGHTAWVVGSSHIKFQACHLLNAYGDGLIVQVMNPKAPIWPHDITFEEGSILGNGRMTVAVDGGENVWIQDSLIGESGYSLFDLEPQWAATRLWNVHIRRNHTRRCQLIWAPMGGLCNAGMGEIYIEDNIMDEAPRPTNLAPIEVRTPDGCARRGPFFIRRNQLKGVYAREGMKFKGIRDTVIEGNTVSWDKVQFNPTYAVWLENSIGVQIKDNQWNGPTRLVNSIGSEWTHSGNKCGSGDCL